MNESHVNAGLQTWGALLRYYRRESRDPQEGGPLTQKRTADLLSERYGIEYTRATLSDWERGQSQVHKDDRHTLISLIRLFHDCCGLQTAEQADEWLVA